MDATPNATVGPSLPAALARYHTGEYVFTRASARSGGIVAKRALSSTPPIAAAESTGPALRRSAGPSGRTD
jgi:hypothetical protein